MAGRKLLVLLICILGGLTASAQTDTSSNQDSVINARTAIEKAAMELYFENRARIQAIRDSLASENIPKVLINEVGEDKGKPPANSKPRGLLHVREELYLYNPPPSDLLSPVVILL